MKRLKALILPSCELWELQFDQGTSKFTCLKSITLFSQHGALLLQPPDGNNREEQSGKLAKKLYELFYLILLKVLIEILLNVYVCGVGECGLSCDTVHVCHSMTVEVRGQPAWVGSLWSWL